MSRFGKLVVQVGLGSAISIASLLLVIRAVDISEVAAVISRAAAAPLLLAVAAIMVDVVLRAWRWRILVAPMAVVPLGRVTTYLLLGYLANNVLPARAGEVVRSHYLGDREGPSRVSVLGTVLVERILDVVALLLLSAGAWWLTGAAPRLGGLIAIGLLGGVAAVAVVVAVIVLPGRRGVVPWLISRLPVLVIEIARKLRAGFMVVAGPRTLLPAIALTLVAWGTTAAVFAAAASAIGFDLTPAQVLLIAAATNLATAIPSAPGYVGTFKFAVVATSRAIGLEAAPALAMGVLVHAAVLLTTTLGGLAATYLVTYRVSRMTPEAAAVQEDRFVRDQPPRQMPPE